MTNPTTDERAEYIAGLRALADLLERNPDLELPHTGMGGSLCVVLHETQREQLAAWARAMPGAKTKSASRDGSAFYLDGQVGRVKMTIIADRGEVCERIVIGTREVTEETPDPEAVDALPKTTVTRVEEVVEWRCHSILDEAGAR